MLKTINWITGIFGAVLFVTGLVVGLLGHFQHARINQSFGLGLLMAMFALRRRSKNRARR